MKKISHSHLVNALHSTIMLAENQALSGDINIATTARTVLFLSKGLLQLLGAISPTDFNKIPLPKVVKQDDDEADQENKEKSEQVKV